MLINNEEFKLTLFVTDFETGKETYHKDFNSLNDLNMALEYGKIHDPKDGERILQICKVVDGKWNVLSWQVLDRIAPLDEDTMDQIIDDMEDSTEQVYLYSDLNTIFQGELDIHEKKLSNYKYVCPTLSTNYLSSLTSKSTSSALPLLNFELSEDEPASPAAPASAEP